MRPLSTNARSLPKRCGQIQRCPGPVLGAERLCCKNYLWTSASEMAALSPDASRRLKLKVELFTDESDGLGEGTGAEAEGAFDDARLAADVLG